MVSSIHLAGAIHEIFSAFEKSMMLNIDVLEQVCPTFKPVFLDHVKDLTMFNAAHLRISSIYTADRV